MLQKNAVFIFILFFYLGNAIKVEVELDEDTGVIEHNGKIYLPSFIRIKEDALKILNQEKTFNVPQTIHNEELAEGAQFWIYISIIACI